MFNTKRIKALEDKINNILFGLGLREDSGHIFMGIGNRKPLNFHEIERHIIDNPLKNYIPCSTCKCLIRKEDAVRGKSEVRPKRTVNEKLGDCLIGKIFEVEQEETIYTPYYCHSKDCKPKK